MQLRTKHATDRQTLDWARSIRALTRRAGVLFILNDRFDLALAAEADGVHLGQLDLPVRHARSIADRLGEPLVIGATATTAEAAAEAEAAGADYIGFGPVFPTASKANPASVKGLEGLRAACEAVSVPVVAIAGITPERVAPCLDAGAWGVAVLSAVTCAADPAAAAAPFRAEIDRWLQGHA